MSCKHLPSLTTSSSCCSRNVGYLLGSSARHQVGAHLSRDIYSQRDELTLSRRNRTIAAAIFVESILVAVQLLGPELLVFDAYSVFPGMQIWRLVTSFCLTGGLGIIFVPYTCKYSLAKACQYLADVRRVFMYGSKLEKESSRFDSASFFMYLIFVGSVIVVGYRFLIFYSPTTLQVFQFQFCFPLLLKHLVYLPGQSFLAVTVPRNEEDYPCISRISHLTENKRGLRAV